MCQGKRERKAAEKKAKAKRKEEARRRKKRPARNPELKIKKIHKRISNFWHKFDKIVTKILSKRQNRMFSNFCMTRCDDSSDDYETDSDAPS